MAREDMPGRPPASPHHTLYALRLFFHEPETGQGGVFRRVSGRVLGGVGACWSLVLEAVLAGIAKPVCKEGSSATKNPGVSGVFNRNWGSRPGSRNATST